MSRRTAIWAGTALVVLAALVIWWRLAGRAPEVTEESAPVPEIVEAAPGEVALQLFFPAYSGRLQLEERRIVTPENHQQLARRIIEELLLGPVESGAVPPLPPWVEIGDVFVSPEGLAYLDLASPDETPPPSSGSLQEMLSIYSLVNSLLMTDPQLTGVVLLWNGEQRPSFAGHLDTSRPLRVKSDLIARR